MAKEFNVTAICRPEKHYMTDTGYIISFNFNKKKQSGVYGINIENKTIIESIV